jgi:hypothetical protein
MENQRTCGQGLAENSALPAKLGEMIGALTGNLEAHMKALDRKDKNARKEHDAYREVREGGAGAPGHAREEGGAGSQHARRDGRTLNLPRAQACGLRGQAVLLLL